MQEINKDMLLKSLGYKFTPEQIAEKYGLDAPTDENRPVNPIEQLQEGKDDEEDEEEDDGVVDADEKEREEDGEQD